MNTCNIPCTVKSCLCWMERQLFIFCGAWDHRKESIYWAGISGIYHVATVETKLFAIAFYHDKPCLTVNRHFTIFGNTSHGFESEHRNLILIFWLHLLLYFPFNGRAGPTMNRNELNNQASAAVFTHFLFCTMSISVCWHINGGISSRKPHSHTPRLLNATTSS